MNYTSRWTITLFSQIFVCNFLHYLVYNASVSYHWNEDSCSKIVWICVNHLENAWRIASSWKRFATIIIFIHLYNTFRSFGYWLLWEEHGEKWVSHIISHLPVYKNKSLHTQICMCVCVCVCARVKCWVVSRSFQPSELKPTRLLCSWDFSGKNAGVGCHFLLQRIFPTQRSKPMSPALHLLGHMSHQGRPIYLCIYI